MEKTPEDMFVDLRLRVSLRKSSYASFFGYWDQGQPHHDRGPRLVPAQLRCTACGVRRPTISASRKRSVYQKEHLYMRSKRVRRLALKSRIALKT